MKTNTGPCEIARASIRLYWTPTDGYERALLAPLNAHHGWSGDPRATPSEALTKATWRAMTGQTVAVIAVLHADGSYRFAIPSEPSPPDAAALVTEAELAEVERLDREATPGPWDADGIHVWDQDGPSHVAEMHTSADARFVGRARATQPRLAAEVRRLTAGLDTARRETADVYAELEGVRAKNLRAVKALDEAQRERDEYRAEVAERDAQIARLAVDSAAVEAKLTIEAMTANQRAADRADALASAEERLNTIGDVARDILLAAEDSAVPEHSDVPTRLIDALRKAVAR